MLDEPITSIEQAEKFYKGIGCSKYHMFREYPQRLEEYAKLKIPKETERKWRNDEFDKYAQKLLAEGTDKSALMNVHLSLRDLLDKKDIEKVNQFYEITNFIRDEVPCEHRVIIAETIVGRTAIEARGGLIFGAFDLKQVDLAKKFCELAIHFSDIKEDEMNESKIGNLYDNDEMILRIHRQTSFKSIYSERCTQATQRCHEIMGILGIRI